MSRDFLSFSQYVSQSHEFERFTSPSSKNEKNDFKKKISEENMIAYRNKKDKIATLKCRICSEEYQGRIHCTLFFIVFFIVFPRLTLTRTNEQILVSPLMCTMSGSMS